MRNVKTTTFYKCLKLLVFQAFQAFFHKKTRFLLMEYNKYDPAIPIDCSQSKHYQRWRWSFTGNASYNQLNGRLLKLSSIDILPNLSVKIPTVGEVLENEQHYYNLISSLTATPYQYMVQLDDIGIDFTQITDYQLFLILFPSFAQGDMSILFGDMDWSDLSIDSNPQNGLPILKSAKNNISIDEFTYHQIAECIRKINHIQKETRRPGNDEAREFRINLERKRQKRNANKPYDPYLEKLVVALVNRPEFKYNYEQVDDLTIYQFNQSFEQIKTSINFDNTMIGVYAGTVDTSKIKDRSCLSWLPVK